MAKEVRKIILSMEEVLHAVESYRCVSPDFLHKGVIVGCKTAGDRVVFSLEAPRGAAQPVDEITLQPIDMVKPLIRFCIETNIMLPRDGRKSILIEQNQLVLLIELDLSVDMPTTLSPMGVKHMDVMSKQKAAAPLSAAGTMR